MISNEETRKAFYDDFTTSIQKLAQQQQTDRRDKNYAKILATMMELSPVNAFHVKCYPVHSDSIEKIFKCCGLDNKYKGDLVQSQFLATIYGGWPLDAEENPNSVRHVFSQILNTSGSASGAVIPCKNFQEHDLTPKVIGPAP